MADLDLTPTPLFTRARLALLLSASIGALFGLGRGWGEVAAHGYASLAFQRSVFCALRDATLDLTWKAALLGVGLFAARELVRLWIPASRPWLSAGFARRLASNARTHWRLLIGILVMVWILALVLAAPDLPARAIELGALTAFAVAALIALHRLATKCTAGDSLLGAIYGAFGLAVIGGWYQNVDFLADPFHPSNVYGNLGLAAAVLLCFAQLRAVVGKTPARPGLATAISLAPVLVVAAIWVAAPFLGRPTIELANPKSVILIGIDTLRFDRTSLDGANGIDRDLTPHMRRLANEGFSFDSAVAPAPWTLPSFASYMTGKYPQQHGAVSLSGRLSESQLTLAEILREAGYRTAGVTSSWYVDEKRGFAQGFDSFDESNLVGGIGATAPGVTDRAIEFLDGIAGDDAYFLFLSYFDPHYEYADRDGHTYADHYDGWLRGDQRQINNLRLKRHMMGPDDVQFLRDLYDEEVAATDREIGRLIDHLESTGKKDDVAIVVVADHGEELMEHGWIGHTVSMYEEVLNVPLIMRLPGLERPRNTGAPVEARLVVPTLIDYLGAQGVEHLAEGSILGYLAAESPWPPTFASSTLRDAPLHSGKRVDLYAVQHGNWKLIRDEILDQDLLFDLSRDPGELENLASSEARQLQTLSEFLKQWRAEMKSTRRDSQLELSEQEEQQLRDLGYL
jgi:arylsulfatase A-like enzyme